MSKPNYPPMGLDKEFKFGKHIGKTVMEIIESSPDYIEYMMDQKIIKLDNEAYAYWEKEK